jgi:predicted ATP-grasp superfamily ATP-dependent carboligase
MAYSARKKTVLVHEFVTGGGLSEEESPPASWIEEGNMMRRALARDLAALPEIDVLMTVDSRLPDEPGPWRTVRVDPNNDLPELARLAATVDSVVCIAPEPDDVLRTRVELIEQVGGLSLGSQPETVAWVSSKFQINTFWQDRGVSVPAWTRYLKAGESLPEDLSFPAVRKPSIGAGCIETVLIESSEHANSLSAIPYDSILQPFVPGIPLSGSFLVDRSERAELVGIGTQKIVVNNGVFQYEGGALPYVGDVPERELLHAVEGIAGLRGWVGLDFIWNPASRIVTMLELNARLTTSFVGWQAWLETPGVLSARWLRAVAGWTIAVPESRPRRRPVTFSTRMERDIPSESV